MNFKLLLIGLILLLFTTQAFAIANTNLQAYYNFDEPSGSVLIDRASFDNNGIIKAGVTLNQTGILGKSYAFANAADSNINVDLNAQNNLTIDLWIYPTTLTGGDRKIFCRLVSGGGGVQYCFDWLNTSQIIRFYITTAGNYAVASTSFPNTNLNAWYHITGRHIDGNTQVYVNGIAGSTTSTQAGYIEQSSKTSNNIGTTGSNVFIGKIDELSFWNRALSNQDIYDLGTGITYCDYNGDFAKNCAPAAGAPNIKIDFNVVYSWNNQLATSWNIDCNNNTFDANGVNSIYSITTTQDTLINCKFDKTGYTSVDYALYKFDSNKTTKLFFDDATAPTIGTIIKTGFSTANRDFNYINGSGTIMATATDAGTGINTCQYSINDGTNWLSADKNSTHCYKSFSITDQNYTFKIRATDYNGNIGTSAATILYIGDINAPTTTFTAFQVPGTLDQNIVLTCNDNQSGCSNISYRIDNNVWNTTINLTNISVPLKAYYKFDDNSTTTLLDSLGTYNGTITNAAKQQAGILNTSYLFDGANDYITTSDFGLNGTKNISISGWFYTNTLRGLDTFWGSRTGGFSGLTSQNSGDFSSMSFYGAGGQCDLADGNIIVGAWEFIVITYDGSNVKMYINNVLKNSCALTGNFVIGEPLVIGSDPIDLSGRGYQGKIDEFGVWNGALTASDINALYNSGSGRSYPFESSSQGILTTSFLIHGVGTHTIDFNSIDLIGNAEAMQTRSVTTKGILNLNSYDENNGAPTTSNIRFNNLDYNGNTTNAIDLNNLATGTYTITFSKTNYGTRYITLDLNQYSDENINMLLLETTQGSNMKYTIFEPDQLTPYANAKVYITRPDRSNYTIGTYIATNKGKVTIFTSIFDQNYLFNINDGENIYQPVALTIKKPIDEESGAVISTNYAITISGAGSQDYNDVVNDKVVYLLPNLDLAYKIKIQDVNQLYFPRNYYKNYYGNPLTDTLQPYLISALTGLLTTLRTISGTSNSPIPNVNVKIYKDLQAGRTLVEDIVTDYKGESLAYMVTGDQYYFDIYYNSILVRSDTIQATSSVIYIRLDDLVYSNPILGDISANINFFPSNQALSSADKKLIQVIKINDSNSTTTITSILIQVWNTDRNGVQGSSVLIFTETIPYADENSITNTIDINALTQKLDGNWYDTNGMLFVKVTIATSSGTNYVASFYYKPYTGFNPIYSIGFGSRSLFGCSSYYDTYGNPNPIIPCPNQLFIALFISFILTAGIGFGLRFNSPAGLGIIFALIMGVFTYLTFVPIVLYGIMVAGLAVLVIVGKGRFN